MDLVDGTILIPAMTDESNRRRRFSAMFILTLKFCIMWFCLLDSWFNFLSHEMRQNIRSVNVLIICTLIPQGFLHIFYTFVLIPESLDWRVHVLASLTDVLFIFMALHNYSESADIKRGILISFISASLAFFTIPLFAKSLKLVEVASVIFKWEILAFFYGLSLIIIALMREHLERQARSNTN